MALYNPVTYFVLLLPLLLPQGVFFHHRSWLVVSFLLLFSPIFGPVGESVYARIARNRHRIPAQENCPTPTISHKG
jgi:hypothetical protein